MNFQRGDWVIWFGYPHRVMYANHEVVVVKRVSDQHLSVTTPQDLEGDQVPWINDGAGLRPLATGKGGRDG